MALTQRDLNIEARTIAAHKNITQLGSCVHCGENATTLGDEPVSYRTSRQTALRYKSAERMK